jgi:hypothetical protein
VSPTRAERMIVITMRALILAFVIVGLLFLITPDGVIGRADDVGNALGSFSAAPRSSEKLWLGLAVAYMTVITGLALLVSLDVARYRPLLLVLAAGKAVSSLTCLGYFIDRNVFAYLANFVVDGSLVGVALACWWLAGGVVARRLAPGPLAADAESRAAGRPELRAPT